MKIVMRESSRIKESGTDDPVFGTLFTDHMFSADWSNGQWQNPTVSPFEDISISPALCSLHYGQSVFDGLKAFRAGDGTVNIFRPEAYHARLNRSSARLCIPEVPFDFFIGAVRALVDIDRAWVPSKAGHSLYIRPVIFGADGFLGVRVAETYRMLMIASPVGAYYAEGLGPVSLTTPDGYVRAAKGGLGAAKTAANYAASLLPAEEARKEGFSQVLWLDACENRYIQEVGAMNIFFVIDGVLVTPKLDGTILPGITRDSVLQLAEKWGLHTEERSLSIDEVFTASKEGRLSEAFGTGTAAVVSPVGLIRHKGESITINNNETGDMARKLYDTIVAIQYGEAEDEFGWMYEV
jgi:branched-chain amino acid aminotransferase